MIDADGAPDMTRLCVYNGGLLMRRPVRRILHLAGYDATTGVPGPDDIVGIWGRSPTAWRGEAVAGWTDAPVMTVEDAFLRSVHPGRIRDEAPFGLCLDKTGVHFDGSQPSDLETLLRTNPLDDTVLLDRARRCIEQMAHWHLGKYCATDIDLPVPDPAYVVVIDQTEGDAALNGAGRAELHEMLVIAAEEHPDLPILVKTHPETAGRARQGHFTSDLPVDKARLVTDPVSPWKLFEHAAAVYTHSSTLGFEAIFAGHKPRVFGEPFYAGWGRTMDREPLPRRDRELSRAQLFAGAMILFPTWYDPIRDELCEIEDVIAALSAKARAWREDRNGYVSFGASRWKRPFLRRAFGREKPLKFGRLDRIGDDRKGVAWGTSDAPETAYRMEDGFIRSSGLGAELVPPVSLVVDGSGLYIDPSKPSDLDHLIAASEALPLAEIERAERLVARISRDRLTKYNQNSEPLSKQTDKHTILVVGQVEDDKSVELGAMDVRTNLDLLKCAREENPDAHLLWKPHPDVEAGLRKGAVSQADAAALADETLTNVAADHAIAVADEMWTITSTAGFEALLRGKPVTCLGQPFYVGWGLTTDLAGAPEHRNAKPTLAGFAHACLIGYPRYFDPRTGEPLSPEQAIWLLQNDPPRSQWGFFQRLFARVR